MGSGFSFFPKEPVYTLLLGMPNSGKTTCLRALTADKLEKTVSTTSTVGFNLEEVICEKVSFLFWDFGGKDMIFGSYRHYYPNAKAIVYVIDSTNDITEIINSKNEICKILKEINSEVPILIFANKQDLPQSHSSDEIQRTFQLDSIKHKWHIQSCSFVCYEGLYEGIKWLEQM
eukprot:Awhi_evm1s9388